MVCEIEVATSDRSDCPSVHLARGRRMVMEEGRPNKASQSFQLLVPTVASLQPLLMTPGDLRTR